MEEEVVRDNSDFQFDNWAVDLKLPRKVIQQLRQEELVTKEALLLVEESDLKALGLPLGCTKLITQEIRKWKGSISPASGNQMSPDAASLDGAGKLLDDLLSSSNGVLTGGDETPTSTFMDPRSLLTMKSTSKKAVHITQFLSEVTKRRRQSRRKDFVLRSSGTETIVLKTEEDHPYLGVLLEEWGAANMRLLNYLLETKELKREDTEYYLAYTARIFEFAEKYEWNSVLHYDFRFRELQAEHQFKWGTFSPYMELQILTPRVQKTSYQLGTGPTSKQEDCKILKVRGECPFGNRCRYRHNRATTSDSQEANKPKNH
ncbi:hypothetical protein DPMN_071528 [Dreissena polymorpha]|uniref:C3H1-type domain-containing protein n=1 Tax=Dreissena polymorpha TaxID=45954 RepID=A0A9D3Z354_DREPO|nr:hypothetical protein DPMN_071528 [Dreissena polymorpha]